MTFYSFRATFRNYPLVSIKEIEKLYPDFDYKNLVYWQKKEYLQKIRNSWYRFTGDAVDIDNLYFIGNHIYAPAYVSLESALSYYGFIPEGVFKITSISTLKTQVFTTPLGIFSYQNVKPSLYFGYQLVYFGNFCFKIAAPEKTILDFLYLHPELTTEDHFFELRWNISEINQQINFDTFHQYQSLFNSKALTKRVGIFLKFLENA
jgi:predicted transcriptional regulator of viral defense system